MHANDGQYEGVRRSRAAGWRTTVNVLVVQDEERIASFLRRGLEAEGFAVRTAKPSASNPRLVQLPA